MSHLYLGLMSGTSVDAIDAALLRCGPDGLTLEGTHEHPVPSALRDQIAAISHAGDNEIERLGPLDRALGALFAEAAIQLLAAAGRQPREVAAIGCHGQTIRHRPPSAGAAPGASFTLQIGDPNTIAELTRITTVADFRRRDVASGGEGAPLAPAFHAAAFATAGVNRAIVNIGGISNVSILNGTTLVAGFDTGPGNTLLDHWIARHLGAARDDKGRWAAQAQASPALLDALLEHPYFGARGPRSTGKEAFNLDWLDSVLAQLDPQEPDRVQSTLAEFTARTIAREVTLARPAVAEVYVCGGGSHNDDLMNRLRRHLPGLRLDSTEPLGIDPDWVEAAAFAWLASRTLAGLPGNSPAVTGAAGARVLGAIYPG